MKGYKRALLIGLYVVPLVMLAFWVPDAQGFRNYQDGCNSSTCHGDFTGPVTQKGSFFPSDDKHVMHNASQQMNTDCDMCHTSGDNRNPFIGSSQIDGNGDPGGPGCTGCHNGNGLRLHHAANGQDFCFSPGCHTSAAAPPEDTIPEYYTSTMTNARGPCNDVAALKTNENWTIGSCSVTTSTGCDADNDCPSSETCTFVYEGLDNDGDNLYDTADPDCQTGPAGSGRVPLDALAAGTPLQLFRQANGDLALSWDLSCLASDDDYGVYEGTIGGTFNNHGFVTCTTAGAQNTTITPAAGDTYYLVVPTNGSVEGSYGLNSAGTERSQGPSTCATQMIGDCP
jgi:hypothetical protein